NINCNRDSGEEKLSNRLIELQPDGFFTFTDSSGNYSFNAIKGQHTVKEILPNGNWRFSCDSAEEVNIDSSSQSISSVNFGNVITEGLNDLSIYAGCWEFAPGFNEWVTIYYANNGTSDLNATISVKLDSLLSYVTSDDSS